MPIASADGVDINYEVVGDAAAPVVVLVSGGGAQLISWHEDFMALLVAEGFRVVRFDNRDTGLSSRFGGPQDVDGGYGVEDMADDVVRVLDDLGVPAAHVVGHSMGGIIGQRLALDHPERVLSLGLLSTIPGPGEWVLHDMPVLAPPPRFELEQLIGFAEDYARNDAPGGPYDPQLAWHREKAVQAFERGYFPEGFTRQWAALLRAEDRLPVLHTVGVPTFVFHGRNDPVLSWTAAVAIAQAMPDAELQVHPGMGHLIPWELWPELVAGIVRTARRAR
jgi:pimeloyl-ACP methyl ester carboxylesterase